MNDKIKNKIQELLDNMPDEFNIMQKGIDLPTQKEYIAFSGKPDIKKYSEKEAVVEGKKLFSKDTDIKTKKKILVQLAHTGDVNSYRIIERYLKNCKNELEKWALLSLQECRMFLENYLSEKNCGFIATGLGGTGNKIRYYFAVGSIDGLSFSEISKYAIGESFQTISGEYDSEIEEITFGSIYALIGVLCPMDIAVGTIIEEGIQECNKMNNIIQSHYYVTNVSKPMEKEILEYLKEIKEKQ